MKFFMVSTTQIILAAVFTGIISGAMVIINTSVKEYFGLPMVMQDADAKCISVANYKNGDNYACADVGNILRNYRIKTN